MQNYSNIQKFLHDFVLSKKIINKSLFELEKIIYLKNKDIKNQSHIFITGLPRSGTTSLLNFIYSSDHYASLTYKNMPFVLSPNFSKLFHKKNIKKKERVHGDGITYDINSPEAFDEVFFNTDEGFIKNEHLTRKDLDYILNRMREYKAIDYTLDLAKHYIGRGKAHLKAASFKCPQYLKALKNCSITKRC